MEKNQSIFLVLADRQGFGSRPGQCHKKGLAPAHKRAICFFKDVQRMIVFSYHKVWAKL